MSENPVNENPVSGNRPAAGAGGAEDMSGQGFVTRRQLTRHAGGCRARAPPHVVPARQLQDALGIRTVTYRKSEISLAVNDLRLA